MMNFIFGRQTFCAVAAFALLAGCGGGMSPGQSSSLGLDTAAQLRALGATSAARVSRSLKSDHHGSWMAPDAAKAKNLLYVADEAGNDVLVYSYPAGKLMGTLTGFARPSGICSNKGGDAFILNGSPYNPTSSTMTVEVYAHGGRSPIRTLFLPGIPGFNCTVDPKTGNLALGAFGYCCGPCDGFCVAVFTKAQGTPTIYTPPGQFIGPLGCGYDNIGNLFCDTSLVTGGGFRLFELPAGGAAFTPVSVSGASSLLGGSAQWDGKDLAVASQSTLYQIRLSGSTGTVVGSTPLYVTGVVGQFWITHDLGGKKRGIRVIAPSWGQGRAEVGYWNYPAGGSPTKTIHGDFTRPAGAALSTLRK